MYSTTKRRLLSLALTLGLVLSLLIVPAGAVWDGSSAGGYDGGSGTRNDPYLISTPAQLALFRDQVNSGKTSICATQTANLDMGMRDWDPIGLSSSGFTGVYDGSGYAIRNLNINRFSVGSSSGGSTVYGGGLFGVVARSGVVKHVNVDGQVSANGEYPRAVDIGAIAGGNLGTIEECFSTCTFRNFDMTITNGSSSSWMTIGGIAGFNSGTIRSCYVIGDINVSVQVEQGVQSVVTGGIVGHQNGSGAVIENCYCAASVRAVSNRSCYTGAIVGQIDSVKAVDNVYANQDLCAALVGNGSTSKVTGSALLSTSDMKTPAFAAKLGNAFAQDTQNTNQGYPILSVMVYEEESEWSPWFDDEVQGTEINRELFSRLTPPELKNRDLTGPINRAEFAAVAVQLYEEMGGTVYDPTVLSMPFTDVSSDAIIKAYNIGITNGVSATEFNPYSRISRQDIATMLTRTYKALALEGWSLDRDGEYGMTVSGVTPFADDRDISAYAKDSVYFMVKNEVIKGVTPTTFAPQNTTSAQAAIGYADATREQAIILAIRMFQKLDV